MCDNKNKHTLRKNYNELRANNIRIMSVDHNKSANGLRCGNSNKLPCIVIKLTEDTKTFMLVDSGASLSIISCWTFERANKLGLQYKHIARNVKISTISGELINYSSCANISCKINGEKFKHTFFITSQLDEGNFYQGILGMDGLDFLINFDSTLDLKSEILKIYEQEIKLYDENKVSNVPKNNQSLRIANNQSLRIAKKLSLEPGESK